MICSIINEVLFLGPYYLRKKYICTYICIYNFFAILLNENLFMSCDDFMNKWSALQKKMSLCLMKCFTEILLQKDFFNLRGEIK